MPFVARGRKGSLRPSLRYGPCVRAHYGRRIFLPPPPAAGGVVVGYPCRPCWPLPAAIPPLPAAAGGGLGVSLVFIMGVFMSHSGFVSVSGSPRVGSVVARVLRCGVVWAFRPLPAGGRAAGFSPAPSALFFGFASRSGAVAFASRVSSLLPSCRAVVRPGCSGSPVFSACGLLVPAFVVKVVLPLGSRVSPSSFAVRLLPLAVGGFFSCAGGRRVWLAPAGSSAPVPRFPVPAGRCSVPLVPRVPAGGVGCSSLAFAL